MHVKLAVLLVLPIVFPAIAFSLQYLSLKIWGVNIKLK